MQEYITDLLLSCRSGYDLLLVYLRLYGFTLGEIARETGTPKTTIYRQLQQIYSRYKE